MIRRRYLAGAGTLFVTSLGGCLTGELVDSDEHNEETYQLTVDEAPTDRPVQHDITMIQPNIRSPERPLTVELSVRNETEKPIQYGERREALGLYQTDRGFQLLAEDDDRYEFDHDSGLWRKTGSIDVYLDYQRDTLAPSETHSQRLVLIAGDISDPSAVPTEFEFEISVSAARTLEEYELNQSGDEWTFGLQTAHD